MQAWTVARLFAFVALAGVCAGRSAGQATRPSGLAETRKLLAAKLAADKRPDFSGHWILIDQSNPRPMVPHELVVRQWLQNPSGTETTLITRILEVERHVEREVTSARYEMDGPEGGVVGPIEGGVAGPGGGVIGGAGPTWKTQYSRRWDGDVFLIEDSRATYASGKWSSTVHRETWKLDANGWLIVTTMDRTPDGEPQTNSLTYRRQ